MTEWPREHRAVLRDGYTELPKPWTNGEIIDYNTASRTRCKCGELMEWRGFAKGHSYRAFAVCGKCKQSIEF